MTGALKDYIRELITQADECKREMSNGSDFNAGRMQGLCEALSILKTEFVGEGEVESLLDFDIDKRYMC